MLEFSLNLFSTVWSLVRKFLSSVRFRCLFIRVNWFSQNVIYTFIWFTYDFTLFHFSDIFSYRFLSSCGLPFFIVVILSSTKLRILKRIWKKMNRSSQARNCQRSLPAILITSVIHLLCWDLDWVDGLICVFFSLIISYLRYIDAVWSLFFDFFLTDTVATVSIVYCFLFTEL